MNEATTITDGYLDVKKAAAYADCQAKTIERAARRKRLRFARVGRQYRFKVEWIDRWLQTGGYDGSYRSSGARAA